MLYRYVLVGFAFVSLHFSNSLVWAGVGNIQAPNDREASIHVSNRNASYVCQSGPKKGMECSFKAALQPFIKTVDWDGDGDGDQVIDFTSFNFPRVPQPDGTLGNWIFPSGICGEGHRCGPNFINEGNSVIFSSEDCIEGSDCAPNVIPLSLACKGTITFIRTPHSFIFTGPEVVPNKVPVDFRVDTTFEDEEGDQALAVLIEIRKKNGLTKLLGEIFVGDGDNFLQFERIAIQILKPKEIKELEDDLFLLEPTTSLSISIRDACEAPPKSIPVLKKIQKAGIAEEQFNNVTKFNIEIGFISTQ